MKHFRTSPILAAALALAALSLLASAAPGAKSAALQEAFPAIAATESSQTPAGQPVVVDLPAGIQANDRLLALVAGAETSLSSVTERFDQATSAGNGGALGIATGLKELAGAFGATTFTLTGGGGQAGFHIALEPELPSAGISFVGAGTPAGGTGSVVPTLPAGWQQDDVFFLFVETDDEAVSTPSGWTAVGVNPRYGGSTLLTTFWRRASASESDPTVSPPVSWGHGWAVILAFRGVKLSGNPWNVLGAAASSAGAPSLPGVTTTVDNCLVIAAVSSSGGPPTAFSSWANAGGFGGAPTGWTKLAESVGTLNTSALFTRAADGSEGATVTMPWTYANATQHWSARITGADPASTAITTSAASSTTTTPDPPFKAPAWGAADTLWIAWLGKRASGTATDYPDNYTDYQFTQGYVPPAGPGAAVAVAARQLTSGSQDPNTFTIPDGQNSSYGTLAIKPLVTPPPPPLPAAPCCLDDFNRANEDPLSQAGSWPPVSIDGVGTTLEVIANRAGQNDGGTIVADSYRTAEITGDAEVYATVAQAPGNSESMALHLHLQGAGQAGVDGYAAQWTTGFPSNTVRIVRIDDSVGTIIASVNLALAQGDTLLLRRIGEGLVVWRKNAGSWAQVVSAIDTSYWSGKLGAQVVTNRGFWDDFGGGAIGGPPPPPPGPPPAAQSYGTDENGDALHGKCGCATVAEPVSTLTGAFTTNSEDLVLPGTGVSFAWSRSYASADATVGRLGPGWTDSYSASLLVQPNGDVLLHGEDGQQLYYTKQGDGSFVGASGSLSTLSSVAGGYKLVRTDQVAYLFDTQGRLASMKDRNDQGLTLAYDGSGRLTTVTDAAGKQTSVSYNASNLVSSVSTQDGRSVSYGYTSGRLTSVTDVRGKTWTYTYDAGGRLATIVDPLNHTQVTNVYDADGRVQSQTDAVGKTTTFAWDATTQVATATDANQKVWKHDYEQNVLAKEIDPLNNQTQLGHDSDLNTSSVTGPTNEQTTMTYDAAGNMLTATAPPSLGSVQKTFVYNARNDPTQVTDARSKVTSYTYTPAGNTQSVTQDGVQVGSYTYDASGRVLTFTDGNEKTWTYTYFPATGYLESVTDPLGNKTTYTYDGAGRVATRVDPKGNCSGCTPADFTWSYTYNPAGQLLTETDPLGHVTTNAYDDAGRLTSTTDANNHTTSYTYDDANRVLTETAPDPDGGGPLTAPVTTYTYDNVGNKLTETGPLGNTTTFAYDSANRLASETGPDPDGAGPLTAPVTTYTYDANGNLASTVEPRGNVSGCNCAADYTTTYTYDAAGRMLTETRPDPDGAGPQVAPVQTNTYDPVGNLASVRDGNNHQTSSTYDAAGRVLTVTGPDLGVTTYTYDDVGNVLTRRDDNNHTTTSAYDGASRLSSETGPDPDGAGPQSVPVTSYTYDANGNRLTLTDPNGNATPQAGDGQTTYGYDRANRLTSIDYSDSTPDVTLTYDNVGNRLTMGDGSGTETRTYDNLDRMLTVTRGANTFSYVYDAASNITRRTHPGGTIADATFDPLNRLTSVESGGQTTSYQYDPASNLTQTTLPSGNGYVETRAYDRAGRLTEVNSQKGATVLARFVATLDPVGNPTQVVRSGSLAQTQTYTYDASDRILSVCFQAGTCPGATDPFIRFTYDKVGNRKTEERPGGTTTNYSYDFRDRLLSAGSTSYSYDQNGNELSAGSGTFTYDLENRLKTTTQGNTTTTYSYDGDGVRLQASTGAQASKKTNFLWDVNQRLPQIALERNGDNALLRRYTYGGRRISMTSGSNTSYYIQDGLGSVANLTSSSGATQWTWSYEPFGGIRTETKAPGSQPTNFLKFTGEYLDPTGLYHLRARQYDPAIGRFHQPDPSELDVGEGFIADYVYVANRPTVLVDPNGMRFRAADDGRVAARLPTSGELNPSTSASGTTVRTPQVVKPSPRSLCKPTDVWADFDDDDRFGFHLRAECQLDIAWYTVVWRLSSVQKGKLDGGRDTNFNWFKSKVKWDHRFDEDAELSRNMRISANMVFQPRALFSIRPQAVDFLLLVTCRRVECSDA